MATSSSFSDERYPYLASPILVSSRRVEEAYSRRVRLRSVANALDLLILIDLPLSGYDVMRCVYSNFGLLLSPGTVYPVLKRLEKNGLLKASFDGHKKIYSRTHLGDLVLRSAVKDYDCVQGKILNRLLRNKQS